MIDSPRPTTRTARWILRPHFDPVNEGKIVRNAADKGKNLKCPADEGKTIRTIVLRYDNYHDIFQE